MKPTSGALVVVAVAAACACSPAALAFHPPTSPFVSGAIPRTAGRVELVPDERDRRRDAPSPLPPSRRRSLARAVSPTPRSARAATALFSLNRLVDEIKESSSSPSSGPSSTPRTVFVGGKGGVGKTTISSSLAVTLASDFESDLNVLIVSTDPAHSLGDALDVDLRSGRGRPLPMTDPVTGGRLYACEVDPGAALESFRENLAAFDVERLADALGVESSLLESLGLREFSGLLNNPPPGLDELVALANVLDVKGDDAGKYDVVVVDTAPTGHTLRMLALPDFIDGFLGKLIQLRAKLSGLANTLQAFLGSEQAAERAATIDTAVAKLEEFKIKMGRLRDRLRDDDRTSFMVVTVPTKLGVAESRRLMDELGRQGVRVTDAVVNQRVGGREIDEDTTAAYYERRKSGQQRWVGQLREAVEGVSSSAEYRDNGPSTGPIQLTEVPFYDAELVGVPALAYLGGQTFENNPGFAHLLEDDNDDAAKEEGSQFVICGGKGGVGKTTTSASLAVSMASQGHNVAIVSTDPAHSLGDALDLDLHGGQLVDVPLIGVPPSDGSLVAMEVDPAQALGQFKGLVDDLIGGDDGPSGDLANTLRDLGEVFDTLPAGTDEVVALAKVVNLVKKGGYDRIVLDTAPTGHTLRMLSTPTFLADLIERVLVISDRVNSNSMVKMLISGAKSRAEAATGVDVDAAAEKAKSTLLQFQLQMYDLEDLFSDPSRTEFLIVTVPTELAVRESVRLLNDLTFEAPDMPIKVRNVVANQVLCADGTDVSAFLRRVGEGEESSVSELREAVEGMGVEVTEVPYIDTEPRGVFGLRALSEELLKE